MAKDYPLPSDRVLKDLSDRVGSEARHTPDMPGYTVTRDGRVFSHIFDPIGRPCRLHVIDDTLVYRSFWRSILWNNPVAFAVYGAFSGFEIDYRHVVHHRDGNPRNCAYSNLITAKQRDLDANDQASIRRSRRMEQAKEVVRLLRLGNRPWEIQKILGISERVYQDRLQLARDRRRETV